MTLVPDVRALPRPAPAGPLNLVGLTREQMRAALVEAGTPEAQARMRTGQLWAWIYGWGVRDFAAMTNLAKPFRAMLAERFAVRLPEVVRREVSSDGTRKYLVRLDGGHEVETVYIPEEGRGTLCVSSQVGCTLTCSFCHTGTQRLVRNLTAAEIVGQVMLARDDLGEWPVPGAPKDETRLLSNLVLMGMGEPLYNFDAVRDAMRVVMDGEGLALSRRRITLSTSGVVPEIARTATEIGCLLAVSFHATTDAVRDVLVPINRKWNIAALLDALREYPRLSNSERITFEYVMLDGVNDSDEDARRLVRLIQASRPRSTSSPSTSGPGALPPLAARAHPPLRRHRSQGGLRVPYPHPAGRGHHGGLRAAQERDRARPAGPRATGAPRPGWLEASPKQGGRPCRSRSTRCPSTSRRWTGPCARRSLRTPPWRAPCGATCGPGTARRARAASWCP
jgi:23S rRNA (adenine2503-C2)-methyltransferase